MVDPVVGPFAPGETQGTATVEVRPRREDGTEDLSLTPTIVTLGAVGDGWHIESATSEAVTFDSPPANMRLIAGFVSPSGTASAFEGTVIVQALLGPDVIDEQTATAFGTDNGMWATRLELGRASGDGYLLAFTTAGTERGAPAFALVPVAFGEAT